MISILMPSGSQAVGLTAWEATANLSVRVYLLYATIYELKHWDKSTCVRLLWVAEDGCIMELPLIKQVLWKNLRMHFREDVRSLCSVEADDILWRRGGSDLKVLANHETLVVSVQHLWRSCNRK